MPRWRLLSSWTGRFRSESGSTGKTFTAQVQKITKLKFGRLPDDPQL